MSGLFGRNGCGCNHNGFGNLFNKRKDYDDDSCECSHDGCGMDCCSIILILLLLTSCCGCEIDWCNIIVLYLLLTMCC